MLLFLRECLWGRPWSLSRIKENVDMSIWEGECGENAAGPSMKSLKGDKGLLGRKYRDDELEGEECFKMRFWRSPKNYESKKTAFPIFSVLYIFIYNL